MLRRLLSVLAGLLVVGCVSTPREPTPNLSILKQECIEWHDSGAYAEAFARAAEPGRRALEHILRGVTPQNFAVVFDIDETLLSNWPYLSSTQFALAMDTFAVWIDHEHATALGPTQAIYAKAHAYQIPIFVVTGRSESMRAATIRNLQEAGYWGWSDLYMKPPGYKDASIIPFKSGVRKMLTERGYDIILNMGDQDSDLAGGYARNRVKLPNPFYYLP